jgi:hypothetical protein
MQPESSPPPPKRARTDPASLLSHFAYERAGGRGHGSRDDAAIATHATPSHSLAAGTSSAGSASLVAGAHHGRQDGPLDASELSDDGVGAARRTDPPALPQRRVGGAMKGVASASEETLRKWSAFCNPASNEEVQRYQILVAVQVRACVSVDIVQIASDCPRTYDNDETRMLGHVHSCEKRSCRGVFIRITRAPLRDDLITAIDSLHACHNFNRTSQHVQLNEIPTFSGTCAAQ